jgi:hypothetical protein
MLCPITQSIETFESFDIYGVSYHIDHTPILLPYPYSLRALNEGRTERTYIWNYSQSVRSGNISIEQLSLGPPAFGLAAHPTTDLQHAQSQGDDASSMLVATL